MAAMRMMQHNHWAGPLGHRFWTAALHRVARQLLRSRVARRAQPQAQHRHNSYSSTKTNKKTNKKIKYKNNKRCKKQPSPSKPRSLSPPVQLPVPARDPISHHYPVRSYLDLKPAALAKVTGLTANARHLSLARVAHRLLGAELDKRQQSS